MATATMFDEVKPENLFFAVGRMHGDDDDTMHTIEAKDHEEACQIFERYLQEAVGDFESEIYVNEVLSLAEAIEHRKSGSDINQNPDQEDLTDVRVVYERQPNPYVIRMESPTKEHIGRSRNL